MEVGLSICIPMYNCEKYIVECLESIKKQSIGGNIEIILIDDCSKDSSKSVVEKYVTENSLNIKIFCNKENAGVAYSRNLAVQKASGKYVMFVDSDDCLTSDFYENVIEYVASTQYDMILFGYNEVDEKIQLKSSYTNQEEETSGSQICKKLSHYNFKIRIGSYLIKKKILVENGIKVSSKYKYGEDQELNYKCLLHSKTVKVLDKCFYNYRNNPNSAMNISCDFRRFDTVESRKELLKYLQFNFEQETELINRFHNYLIPEAIITVTRVLAYAGIDKKALKQYLSERGYVELMTRALKQGALSKGLHLEWVLQRYAWMSYSILCKIKKHRKK